MGGEPMQPLPGTAEAMLALEPLATDGDLLSQLAAASARVRVIVPECIGMSLTLRAQGVTFTLVASDSALALLDAAQYLDDGPCIEAVRTGEVIDFRTRERADWPLFAAAAEHYGVLSTLSMPLLATGPTAGGINLYGGTAHCFDLHHDELAATLGAWAGGAVVDADLSFATRAAAREAPRVLREATSVDIAVGILAVTSGLDVGQARQRLTDAARRAGIRTAAVAALVADVLGGPG